MPKYTDLARIIRAESFDVECGSFAATVVDTRDIVSVLCEFFAQSPDFDADRFRVIALGKDA